MLEEKRLFIHLHLAIFIFGFIAVLGELINLSYVMITWWRTIFSVIGIAMLAWVSGRQISRIPSKINIRAGMIIGFQWLTFFLTIKLSNASVAVVCISTAAFMTSIFEPLYLKQKMNYRDLWISLLIVPAMILITNDMPESMLWGVLCGLVSAFLSTLYTVICKKHIHSIHIEHMAFWQFIGAFIAISFYLLCAQILFSFEFEFPEMKDLFLLIALGFICTGIGYTLFLSSLRAFSAYRANMVVNLEPVYGIIFGAILLNNYDELTVQFYFGAGLILLTLFLPQLLAKILQKKDLSTNH